MELEASVEGGPLLRKLQTCLVLYALELELKNVNIFSDVAPNYLMSHSF